MSGKNIVLTGFMGAGKTSIGKALSRKLKLPFLDTDRLIVEKEGMSINQIFRQKGEERFRILETQTLQELCRREDSFVLSTGGGLPLREENRPLLRQIGCVIYLKTGVETLEKRLEGDTTRPLLQHTEGTLRDRIEQILQEREPKYMDAADRVILNDGKSFYAVVKEIAAVFQSLHSD